jgi:hypothetical protein
VKQVGRGSKRAPVPPTFLLAEKKKPERALLGLLAGFRRGDEERVKPAASN